MEGTRRIARLMNWLSPTFPVGAFAYSHGIETAVSDKLLIDEKTLRQWLQDLVVHGSGWNDAVFVSQAWKAFVGKRARTYMFSIHLIAA